MQLGGGITIENANVAGCRRQPGHRDQLAVRRWHGGLGSRAQSERHRIGKDRLVIDLSCRRVNDPNRADEIFWRVATDRWQTVTETAITVENLERSATYCSEFLIHAADVEGLQGGIDDELVTLLGQHSPFQPPTPVVLVRLKTCSASTNSATAASI